MGIDMGKETEWNEPLTFQYEGVLNQRIWVNEVEDFVMRNAVGFRIDKSEKNAENVGETQEDNESKKRNVNEDNTMLWEEHPDKKNKEDQVMKDNPKQTLQSQEGTKTKDTAKSEDSGKETSEVRKDNQDFDIRNDVTPKKTNETGKNAEIAGEPRKESNIPKDGNTENRKRIGNEEDTEFWEHRSAKKIKTNEVIDDNPNQIVQSEEIIKIKNNEKSKSEDSGKQTSEESKSQLENSTTQNGEAVNTPFGGVLKSLAMSAGTLLATSVGTLKTWLNSNDKEMTKKNNEKEIQKKKKKKRNTLAYGTVKCNRKRCKRGEECNFCHCTDGAKCHHHRDR